jgi:23S rRNA (guanosine2251-2'-O)-methyltransferase
MPYLDNRNSILESLRSQPDEASRLWVEAGHERVCSSIMEQAKRSGISIRVLPKDQFEKRFKGNRSHVVLEKEGFHYTDPDTFLARIPEISAPLVSAFDGIYDPQNLGSVIRTAACFGFDAVIMPRDNACGITDTVANVARGGIDHVQISRVTNFARYLEDLKKRNIFCFGLDEQADKDIFEVDLAMPLCLVLGGEDGLRRLTKDRCDLLVKIPASEQFPSLNVANAFAIAAYEAVRQRSRKAKNGKIAK